MEVQDVACGPWGAQWIVARDNGSVFLSSRTLAPALGLKQVQTLVDQFKHTALVVDRGSLPAASLAFAKEKVPHYFLLLSHLLQKLSKEKYLVPVCDITGYVLAFIAKKAFEAGKSREDGRRASASGVSAAKTRRISALITDVAFPSPGWVDNRVQKEQISAMHGPQRLSFEHLLGTDFPETSASPAFPGRQSMPPPSGRILRPVVPRSVVFSESELHLPAIAIDAAAAEEFLFEEEVHANVLRIHQLENVRLELRPLVGVGPIVSDRGIEEITACANNSGHDVAFIGSPSGLGRFAWKLSLKLFGNTPSLKSALSFFGMVRSIEIYSHLALEKRQWFARSQFLGEEDLEALLQELVCGIVPLPEVHADFQTNLSRNFTEIYPWLRESRGTSLTAEAPKMLQNQKKVIFVSPSRLLTIANGHRCCNRRCTFRVGGQVGLEAVGEFVCRVCADVSLFPLFGGKQGELNHTAYVVQMMSGRPNAIVRWLDWLGVGSIPSRTAQCSFLDKLWRATEKIYLQCSKLMIAYIVLSESPTVSVDAFHKRMAKAYSVLGESFSTGISIADPRIQKILHIFFTERRVLDDLRRADNGEIRFDSPVVGKPKLTTSLGGIEHSSFDLAMQALRDLFADARLTLLADTDLLDHAAELAMRLGDWKLGSIVSDALSSAPNSVKKTFPDTEHFIDWWHRRSSFKKEVSKAENKKKDKKPQNPGFEGATVALGNVFSDCMYAKMTFQQFSAEVDRLLLDSGVNVCIDEGHKKAWDKLMGKAEKMYSQSNIEMGSGINERFHAHVRFFCLKGDAMSTTHWKIAVCFAFLSFNNFPDWQILVKEEFLSEFN